MQVSLIIPALNEADCLGPLLNDIPPGIVQQVIVADNGSTDRTAEIARTAGALVVTEPRRGYGYACAAGAAAAHGDVLVFMDGDGSFDPADLPLLTAPVLHGEAGLVLGTRMLGPLPPGAMPLPQRLGNHLVPWLLNRFYGSHLTDLGPLRAIRRELFDALEMQELTFGWTVEMMVKAAHRRARIVEIPVSYRPRRGGKSKIGGSLSGTILATYHILRVLLRYGF